MLTNWNHPPVGTFELTSKAFWTCSYQRKCLHFKKEVSEAFWNRLIQTTKVGLHPKQRGVVFVHETNQQKTFFTSAPRPPRSFGSDHALRWLFINGLSWWLPSFLAGEKMPLASRPKKKETTPWGFPQENGDERKASQSTKNPPRCSIEIQEISGAKKLNHEICWGTWTFQEHSEYTMPWFHRGSMFFLSLQKLPVFPLGVGKKTKRLDKKTTLKKSIGLL